MSVTLCCAAILVMAVFLPTSTQGDATEAPEPCYSPMQGVMVCNVLLQSAIKEKKCWTAQEFITCMAEVQQRCSAHPQLGFYHIPGTIASIRSMLVGLCRAPGTDTVIDVDEDVDEALENTSPRCPKSQAKFYRKLSRCQRSMGEPTSYPPLMCKAFSKVKRCVRRLVDSCKQRSWMSGELEQTMENTVRAMRQSQKQMYC